MVTGAVVGFVVVGAAGFTDGVEGFQVEATVVVGLVVGTAAGLVVATFGPEV